jgi:type IV secretory pathway TrbD component
MTPSTKKLPLYIGTCLLICGGLIYLVVGLFAREWYAAVAGLLFVVAGTAGGWYAREMDRQTGWRLAAPLIVTV